MSAGQYRKKPVVIDAIQWTGLNIGEVMNFMHPEKLDQKWMTQEDFAEHIETGYGEFHTPRAADMLELSRSLQAAKSVEWKSSIVLQNGQRQFTYAETVEAKAGQKGTLEVPQKFTLGLAVFEGQTEGYKVEARFQFRENNGALRVRYLITRPHDIIRTAFDDVVGEVEDGVGLAAFRGTPPHPKA